MSYQKLIAIGVLFATPYLHAAEPSEVSSDMEPLIVEVETVEVETPYEVMELIGQSLPIKKKSSIGNFADSLPDVISAIKNGDIILDLVINIGTKIWNLVEKGKPKVHINFPYAHAMPYGIESPTQLEYFSEMNFRSYQSTIKNLYGVKVFDVVYTAVHQYGGRLADTGDYLGNVTILPSRVDVAWGYDVQIDVREVGASNMGSAGSPVAGLLLEVRSRVKTALKESVTYELFNFRGDSPNVVLTKF